MFDNEPAGAIADGRPQAQAFAFASEWKDLVNELTHNPATHGDAPDSAFAKEAIRRLTQRFAGKTMMIGFDVGIFKPADRPDEAEEKRHELDAFEAIIADLGIANAALSIYLEAHLGRPEA